MDDIVPYIRPTPVRNVAIKEIVIIHGRMVRIKKAQFTNRDYLIGNEIRGEQKVSIGIYECEEKAIVPIVIPRFSIHTIKSVSDDGLITYITETGEQSVIDGGRFSDQIKDVLNDYTPCKIEIIHGLEGRYPNQLHRVSYVNKFLISIGI